jgi:Outer membrane protein beta-barrel domain
MKKIRSKKDYSAVIKKKYLQVILGIVLITASFNAIAQKKFSFEIRPGINFATKDLGDASLKTGFGFEGAFAYKFMPHLAAYAGWSWNKFSADKSFAGNNVDFEETGYCFGLKFIHPLPNSNISYMIKAGGTYNHIETENSAGKIINDTGHGFGWQLGTGLAVPLGKRWQLIPEVRYRSLARDIKIGDGSTSVDLNYISGGIGLSFAF